MEKSCRYLNFRQALSFPYPRKRHDRKRPGRMRSTSSLKKIPLVKIYLKQYSIRVFWAILFHRVAHTFYNAHIPFFPRLISQFARAITGGIEIHPGAQIGKRFFIDHGAGVVIGETAIIGDNVMLYHQVTLGATGWWRPSRLSRPKRHPTIEDNVTIGVGAAILGPITIGKGSRIGGMTLVLESVPPNSVVASKPAELLVKGGEMLEKHQELTQGWNGKDPWEMDYQI